MKMYKIDSPPFISLFLNQWQSLHLVTLNPISELLAALSFDSTDSLLMWIAVSSSMI